MKINNSDRETWVMNDTELYHLFQKSRLHIRMFVNKYKNQIDRLILETLKVESGW